MVLPVGMYMAPEAEYAGAVVVSLTEEAAQPTKKAPEGASALGSTMLSPAVTIWLATAFTPEGTVKDTVYPVSAAGAVV